MPDVQCQAPLKEIMSCIEQTGASLLSHGDYICDIQVGPVDDNLANFLELRNLCPHLVGVICVS